jgi:hypothetical protein
MLTSLDKFDNAAVVGCCARRAEISVALPPNSDFESELARCARLHLERNAVALSLSGVSRRSIH